MYNGQRVLLTSQLAECYEVTTEAITKNFNRNKTRYQEGKHFLILEGDKLKEVKQTEGHAGMLSARANKLYLWTKEGAKLHARSLNSDKVWDTYDELEETYFDAKEDVKALVTSENDGIQNFFNPEFGEIRIILIDDEPWFVGKDIAEALGYENTRDALAKHVDNEDTGVAKCDTLGGKQDMPIINESGLYSLILSSKLPTAKRFKRWVTAEVLPAIRKTGGYIPSEGLSDMEILSRAVLIAKKTIEEKNKELAAQKQTIAKQTQTISAQAEKIEEDAPKVQFADSVAESPDCILICDLAKLLNQNRMDIGEKRLFARLREEGYLIKQRGSSWNLPTQRAMDLGLFKVSEKTVTSDYGDTKLCKTTQVTGKGQQYFLNKYLDAANAQLTLFAN